MLNDVLPSIKFIIGALIETIDDAVDTFEGFWSGSVDTAPKKRHSQSSEVVKSVSFDQLHRSLTVFHSSAEQLDETERVAFSFKNLTGQRIRVHTQSALETDISSSKTTITYLDHLQLMHLSFPATISVIKNLESVEVPFKGDQNLVVTQKTRDKGTMNHVIDIQIPGFRVGEIIYCMFSFLLVFRAF